MAPPAVPIPSAGGRRAVGLIRGLALLSCTTSVCGLLVVPTSPLQMVKNAATAVASARAAGHLRVVVRLVVPPLDSVKPEDLDPWPGGLVQQYPYALDLAEEVMQQAVGCARGDVRSQVLDAEDACGLITAQGEKASDDAACLLFVGCDQLDQLERVDAMAGERLLVLFNPQFRRASDFPGRDQARAQELFFDRGYKVGYAFEEFACRGEDVKLVGSVTDGWRAYIMLDDADPNGVVLHEGDLPERPEYAWLEKQINTRHPSPRWARNLDKVDQEGPLFLRKPGPE